MRNRKLVLTLVYLLLPAIGFASDSLQKQLTEQYRDKVLALRHSFVAKSQEYDDAGAPITLGDEGPWTVYGRMSVKKVALNDKALRLEGRRVVYIQVDKKGFVPSVDREDVKIAIRLKSPLTTIDQAAAIINLIVNTPEDVVNSAPSYWQDYLRRQAAPTESKQHDQQARNSESAGMGERGVYSITEKGVSRPQALFSPEPNYSNEARARRYQGTVGVNVIIDKTGSVRNVQIAHPLGMGLDENSVSTVRTWRFSPAMRNGEPVAVTLYVEFGFHLY